MTQTFDQFGLDDKDGRALIKQAQEEIINAETFMRPEWAKRRKQLKLLNNKKRNDSDVGDPLAHIHFNTLLASLYDDELNIKFLPREMGDVTVTENLNPLYEYDCVLMNKPEMDYQWLWNTMLFSRSLVMMFEFDREKKIPLPEVVNMMTWYRDPNAKSVNGDSRGRGAMRFGGRPILMTKKQMEDAKIFSNLDELSPSTSTNDILVAADDARRTAEDLGGQLSDDVSTENEQFVIMEWLTTYKGKKVVIDLGNDKSVLVRYTVLKDQEEWGIIDQTLFPNGISWDGVSVMDLIEDKQRARARIINAMLFSVEANGNHMYAYDVNKIQNESDLDFELNKHVPVNGDPSNVISPIQRNQIGNEVDFILNFFDTSAGKATGATEVQQGAISGAKKTATEIATVSESTDTRFNLMAKVVSWSEKAFARYWYKMYKMHFKDTIDEKILRIVGQNGVTFKSFTRENLMATVDPDVSVKSRIVGESRRLRKLQEWNAIAPLLLADPSVNRDTFVRDRAKLSGLTEMEINQLFKPDPERVIAQEENLKLNKGESVKINKTDDDMKHNEEHAKSASNKATIAHMKKHTMQYLVKNKNPQVKQEAAELLPPPPEVPEIGEVDTTKTKTLQTA